jgi:hypothetical protein
MTKSLSTRVDRVLIRKYYKHSSLLSFPLVTKKFYNIGKMQETKQWAAFT